MRTIKYLSLLAAVLTAQGLNAQVMTLQEVVEKVKTTHPVIKMYDQEIRSMDEAAKGARAWMPTQIGTGFFMTPYNPSLWKREGGEPGMGSVMISGEQMFPNKKKLDADESYMKAMSAAEKERKHATLNDLVAEARGHYLAWIILQKRLVVLKDSERILDFMIRNAEIRYKNNMEKIGAYYKAKAAIGQVKNMQLMYNSDINERRIRLNTLMANPAMAPLEIDTSFQLSAYAALPLDTAVFYTNRSDLKALDKDLELNKLKVETERMNLKPQFGVKYDHMFGFGGSPMLYTLMGMVRIPLVGGASRMSKANMESLKYKSMAVQAQKEMMVNEYMGMAYGMQNEIALKQQQMKLYEQDILPALRNNYKTMQLAYEQNTGELFMLYDAWEVLNMKQMEYLDLLAQSLSARIRLEQLLQQTN